MKRHLLLFAVLFTSILAMAQEGVTWSYRLVGDKTASPALEMTAKVAPGFHMYSQDNPAGGGVPLEFHFDLSGCRLDGPAKANKAYTKAYDDILEVDEIGRAHV